MLLRGQERFNIYCSPCHGLTGAGDGLVSRRADALQEGTWVPPLTFHGDQVRGRPVGHLFNTITHGIRNMPAYGAQIPAEDRWAIVAYVRALQRSQNATVADVPPDLRAGLR
jgi:mono/diheme cytochrome c family protein